MMTFDRGSTDRNPREDTSLAPEHAPSTGPSPGPLSARAGKRPAVASHTTFGLGVSPAMSRVQELVERSAASDAPVLITGEIGVRKDLVARAIHRLSARGTNPMLEVHCASLPDDFFESSLPAEAATASEAANRSTGNQPATPGYNTLFLDEIGELSLHLQDRLVQRLRRGDALRIDSAQPQRADFRLIGATHRDLTQAIEAGAFSEELYYRVNLIHIHVPPLRARPEDIPALFQSFIREHGEREGWQGEVSEQLLVRFRSYAWPGNVRELENAVRRLIALRDPAYVLAELEAQSEHYARRPTSVASDATGQAVLPATQADGVESVVDLKELGRRASDLAERQAIVDMLGRTLGNKKAAAQRLGISYKALLYKIRDFAIAEPRRRTSRRESADNVSPTRA